MNGILYKLEDNKIAVVTITCLPYSGYDFASDEAIGRRLSIKDVSKHHDILRKLKKEAKVPETVWKSISDRINHQLSPWARDDEQDSDGYDALE